MKLSKLIEKLKVIAEEHPCEDPQVCEQECEVIDAEYNEGIVDIIIGSLPDFNYYQE